MSLSARFQRLVHHLKAVRANFWTIGFVGFVFGMAATIRLSGWVVKNSATYAFIFFALLGVGWIFISLWRVNGLRQELGEVVDFLGELLLLRDNASEPDKDEVTRAFEFDSRLPPGHFGREIVQISADQHEDSSLTRRFTLSDDAFTLTPRAALDQVGSFMRVGVEQVPALFTALGILFTFFGLVTGLDALDLSAGTEELKGGLQHLLGSVGVAFQSSLAGIFLSFTSLVAARVSLAKLSRECDELRANASRLEHSSAPEQVLQRMEQKHTESNRLMSRLIDIAEQQDEKLGTLGTDIKTALDETLNEALTKKVAGPLLQMSDNLNEFANRQLDAHTEALDGILSGFNEQFSENLGGQFQRLSNTLEDVLEWHEETRGLYQSTWEKLKLQVEAQSEALELQKELLEAQMADGARRKQQFVEIYRRLDTGFEKVDSLSNTLGSHTEAMSGVSDELVDAHNRLVTALDTVDGLSSTVAAATKEATTELESRIHEIENVFTKSIGEFEENLGLLPERYKELLQEIRKELQGGLKDTFREFDKETAQVVQRLSGSYIQIDDSLANFDQSLQGLSGQLEQLNQWNGKALQLPPDQDAGKEPDAAE